MTIRDATQDDLPGILAIYNDAVLNTTAIWNETPSDLAGRAAWWRERTAAGFPVLVHAPSGEVEAYGTFGPFRPHEGYRVSVEHSIYVAAAHRGRGLGAAMLARLEEEARAMGKHVMIGGISAENAGSIALHLKAGFREVGRLPDVGVKFGAPLDLVLLQKNLRTLVKSTIGD